MLAAYFHNVNRNSELAWGHARSAEFSDTTASAEMVQRYAHLATEHLSHWVDRRSGLQR